MPGTGESVLDRWHKTKISVSRLTRFCKSSLCILDAPSTVFCVL